MFAIGNDELEKCGKLGKSIQCKMCGKKHHVRYGEEVLRDGTRKPSKMLAFYKCKGITYLAGINGKAIGGKT
uniref:Uncharacterized protein n=1 Tax=viral metagenome TaxID=1070528 RepID=A0A6M3LKK7_9ZZZZ